MQLIKGVAEAEGMKVRPPSKKREVDSARKN
jgi:hypothetical protein